MIKRQTHRAANDFLEFQKFFAPLAKRVAQIQWTRLQQVAMDQEGPSLIENMVSAMEIEEYTCMIRLPMR